MSFPRYPQYKPSGVQWLGDVPEHWDVKRLKYIAPLVTERAESRANPVALENIEGWTGNLVPTDSQFEGEGTNFHPGDILFGKLRPYLAKIHLATNAGEAVGDFHVLRPAAEIYGRFLQHAMLRREFIDIINGTTFGSKMPRVGWEALGGMPTAYPRLSEQRAIASFLDRETAKIDALVAEQQRLIELLKEKRQAVISHAVTKGLDPKAPMKPSGVEWLGDVPAHWEVQRLGNLLREFPCYGVLVPDFEIDGVPMLRIQDMTATSIARNDLTTISRSLSQQYSRTVVEVGDLVLSVVGTIGQSLVIDTELEGVNLSRAVARLQMRDLLLPQVCRWIFCSDYFCQYVDLVCVGTAQRVLNMADLRAFKVAIPPQDEQSAIIAALNAKTWGIDVLLAEAKSAITLLQERRSALISAAVTGQIDVRNAVAMEAA